VNGWIEVRGICSANELIISFSFLHQLISTMADKPDSTPSESTLRNRKTTVEDAGDDSDTSPVATTTATSVSSPAPASSASKKKDTPSKQKDAEDDKKKKALAARARRPPQAKPNRLRSFVVSLLVATAGVLLKSGYDKFWLPSREIAINQTVGVQGNCYKTACRWQDGCR
jgi:hypothetical protein